MFGRMEDKIPYYSGKNVRIFWLYIHLLMLNLLPLSATCYMEQPVIGGMLHTYRLPPGQSLKKRFQSASLSEDYQDELAESVSTRIQGEDESIWDFVYI